MRFPQLRKAVRAEAARLGMKILDETRGGGGHYKLRMQNRYGIEWTLTLACSGSDHREWMNTRALIRRQARAGRPSAVQTHEPPPRETDRAQ